MHRYRKYGNWLFMFGYRHDYSEKKSLVAEYIVTNGKGKRKIPQGILTLGVRGQIGNNATWEVAGFRTNYGTGDFVLFVPLVKATWYLR